jgi:hypothetical protein
MQQLIDAVNDVLARHAVAARIALGDLVVTDTTISDLVVPDFPLSTAVEAHVFPSVASANVFHFTSRAAAEEILNSNLLRLTNIEKRFADDEIRSFCEAHGLDGYLETDSSGDPKYRSLLMSNTFYASFTDAALKPSDEAYFWQTFAPGDGVRLKFRISATNSDFRRVVYGPSSGQPIQLLRELSTLAQSQFNRHFVLKGVSRLCAFYLRSDYAHESEYRALWREWPGLRLNPKGTAPATYVEIPMGAGNASGFEIHVVEACSADLLRVPAGVSFAHRN